MHSIHSFRFCLPFILKIVYIELFFICLVLLKQQNRRYDFAGALYEHFVQAVVKVYNVNAIVQTLMGQIGNSSLRGNVTIIFPP